MPSVPAAVKPAQEAPQPPQPDVTAERWREQSQVLIEVARSKAMARGLFDEAAQLICRKIADTLRADRVGVWFYEEAKTQLACKLMFHRGAKSYTEGDTLEGEVHPEYFASLLSDPMISASDASKHPKTSELYESYLKPNQVHSLLVVPFFSAGKMKGTLTVETKEPREWAQYEEQFVASLAEFVSLAIESNERRRVEEALLESEARLRLQGAALMRLARSENLSSGQQAEALKEITEAAAETLNCERASIWLLKPDFSSIYCIELFQRSANKHESGIELKAEQFPPYFEAIKTERAIDAHDAQTDPRTSCFTESYLRPLGITSMLDAPIRVGGRMIGVICHEHIGKARTWLLEEMQFAGSLADFIALAIEANERRKAQAELKQMLQLMRRFVPGSVDENPEG